MTEPDTSTRNRHEIAQRHADGDHALCGEDCIGAVRIQRDRAYRERADLLALLTTFLPSVITPCHTPDAPGIDQHEIGWHLLYLVLDGQQLSFHIHPDDMHLFRTVDRADADDPRTRWDGHNTEEKYERIRSYVAGGGNETIHYTADVVAVTPSGKFLAIERRWDPDEGKMALPGGHVNRGETARSAAAREALEETGVPVDPDALEEIGGFDAPGRDSRGRYVSAAFLARVPEDTTAVAGSDARNTAWLPLDAGERPEPLAFDHDAIVAAAREAL